MDGVLKKIEKDGTNSVKKVQNTGAVKPAPVPEPECPDVPRFEIDSKDGLDYLEEHGYVVFKNVLSSEEIERAKDICWKWVEALPYRTWDGQPLQRNNPATWITEAWPGDSRNGLINSDGAGHSDFSWYIRGIPNVKRVFSNVWEEEDLLVSFDGFSMFRPWSYDPKWKTVGGWYHVDQNAITKPGKQCVQGIVTIYDVDERTGGLTVIPDSHKLHDEIGKDLKIRHEYDYVSIPRRHDIIQKPGIIIRAKAGDMLLWDSRTIHCNSPALKTPRIPRPPATEKPEISENSEKEKSSTADAQSEEKSSEEEQVYTDSENWELLRLACYVCMTPKSKVRKEEFDHMMQRRKWAVENSIGTTHWPHEFHIHSGATRGAESRDLSQFSDKQLSLIGISD